VPMVRSRRSRRSWTGCLRTRPKKFLRPESGLKSVVLLTSTGGELSTEAAVDSEEDIDLDEIEGESTMLLFSFIIPWEGPPLERKETSDSRLSPWYA